MTDREAAPGLRPGVRRREVWAWAMYDFANSGYTTVVLTAVFSAYFVGSVADGQDWATLLWSSALAVSSLLVMLTMPAIGAYADLRAAKKRLLQGAPDNVKAALGASVLYPKRLGNPEEYAGLALEMCRNSYFNGEDVRLDGGIRMAPR